MDTAKKGKSKTWNKDIKTNYVKAKIDKTQQIASVDNV